MKEDKLLPTKAADDMLRTDLPLRRRLPEHIYIKVTEKCSLIVNVNFIKEIVFFSGVR